MKIEISKKEVEKAVSKFNLGKVTLPILEFIKLETGSDTLILSGTNLEKALIVEIPCKVLNSGTALINIKKLKSTIKILPTDSIIIDSAEIKKITIKSGEFSICFENTIEKSQDIPLIPKLNKKKHLTLNAETFGYCIKRICNSASTQETRYVLNGILLENCSNNKLRMVATDGRRLAIAEIENKGLKENIIIPSDLFIDSMRLFKKGLIFIYHDKNNVFFKQKGITLVGRLIDGNFPQYRQVIPLKKISFNIDAKKLYDANKRIYQTNDKDSYSYAVHYVSAEGILSVRSETKNKTTLEEIKTDYKGKDLSFKLNAEYVCDALDNAGSETVNIYSNGFETNPIAIRDGIFTYAIMPVRA